VKPLSRDMPCPSCDHPHLHLPCDVCPCVEQTVPGVYPKE
jgi:hypothetical protein